MARQTVDYLKRGHYSLADGTTVSIGTELEQARAGTRLYTPDSFDDVFAQIGAKGPFSTVFEVENCTTLAAARRQVASGASVDPLCLNFASAKNPGGGFLNGSQAQEESLARASGLYACIEPVRAYYEANRACSTCLYTHHIIYSPQVPIFRDDNDQLLRTPYRTSIITAPAVNAGAVRQNEPQRESLIEQTMLDRVEMVLAVAALHQHATLILGAWGCGVFKNNPNDVARWFHWHLTRNDRFQGRFRRVVFAVFDKSDSQNTFRVFARRFGGATMGM